MVLFIFLTRNFAFLSNICWNFSPQNIILGTLKNTEISIKLFVLDFCYSDSFKEKLLVNKKWPDEGNLSQFQIFKGA